LKYVFLEKEGVMGPTIKRELRNLRVQVTTESEGNQPQQHARQFMSCLSWIKLIWNYSLRKGWLVGLVLSSSSSSFVFPTDPSSIQGPSWTVSRSSFSSPPSSPSSPVVATRFSVCPPMLPDSSKHLLLIRTKRVRGGPF